jgi:hypothetical protein
MEQQRAVQAAFELRGGRSILGIERKGGFSRAAPRRRLVIFTRLLVIRSQHRIAFAVAMGRPNLETIA